MYFFQTKHTEAILPNSTRKLLRFEITSASELMTLWRYTNLFITIIITNMLTAV